MNVKARKEIAEFLRINKDDRARIKVRLHFIQKNTICVMQITEQTWKVHVQSYSLYGESVIGNINSHFTKGIITKN